MLIIIDYFEHLFYLILMLFLMKLGKGWQNKSVKVFISQIYYFNMKKSPIR